MNNTDKAEKTIIKILSGSVKMRRLILITGVVIYSLFAASMIIKSNIKEKPAQQLGYETYAVETVSKSAEKSIYVVKTLNGKVAVEDIKTGKIIKKTDTLVSVLPRGDQKMLRKGIKVDNDEQLRLLLEDFCS